MNAIKLFVIVLISFSALLATTGCERKELPVPMYQPDATTKIDSLNLRDDYRDQVFYSFEDHSVVGAFARDSWDLGFEADVNGINIILNDAKAMYAYAIDKTELGEVQLSDTIGYGVGKRWDASSHNPDSLALSDWHKSIRPCYILDRGAKADGTKLGLYRIRILSVNDVSYQLLVSKLENDTVIKSVSVPKRVGYNYTYLSLDDNEIVEAAPPQSDWDVVFSLFTYTFYEPYYTPYSVMGCLLNPYKTGASHCSKSDYDLVSNADAQNAHYSTARDAIGYDWKSYDINLGKYAADPKKVYILRTQTEKTYKLHFTDYNDATGVKGHPRWEYQEL